MHTGVLGPSYAYHGPWRRQYLPWQVHAGVLDHHDSLWDTRPGKRGHAMRQRGMSEWLAEIISLAASREPPRRLLFIGLSFGAALAQLTGT